MEKATRPTTTRHTGIPDRANRWQHVGGSRRLVSTENSFTGTTSTVRLAGGLLGEAYAVSNTVTLTPSGQLLTRNLRLAIVLE